MTAARPLRGRTVVVTRPREQAASLAQPLTRLGADVLLVPTIRIAARAVDRQVRDVVRRLEEYALVVFTSANGVRAFFGQVEEIRGGPAGPALGGVLTAAVGPATAAALERRGVALDIVAEEYVAEGLVRALRAAAWCRPARACSSRRPARRATQWPRRCAQGVPMWMCLGCTTRSPSRA